MASQAKIMQALPDTLPEDFSEWDRGHSSATIPVKPRGFEPASDFEPKDDYDAAPKAYAEPARSRVKVVAVMDGSTIAPPFTAADFYAGKEAISRSALMSLKRKNRKRMTLTAITVVSILALLAVTPRLYPNLLPKLANVRRSVGLASTADSNSSANKVKPSPSTLLTKDTQPVANTLKQSSATQALSPTQTAVGTDATTTKPQDAVPPQVESKMMDDQLAAPTRIPHDIKVVAKEEAPPSAGFAGTGMDGLANNSGNAVGRVFANGNKVPKVNVETPTRVNLSSGVAAGMLVKRTLPVYPAIAKAAGVSGTVVMQATISRSGMIQNLHVIAGPVMLQQAAIDAVNSWRYRPYMLDGKPVEVDTSVNVVFTKVVQ